MDGKIDGAALLARLRTLEAAGDEAGAELLLRRARADPGLHEAAAALQRERLIADGSLDAAVERFPVDPADRRPFALLGRAIAAHRRGDFAAAAGHAADALHADAADTLALNHRARALHNLGRRDEALAAFRSAVRLDPGSAIGWHNLGQALRGSGALPEAVQAFSRAAALRPGYRAAQVNLAKTLLLAEQAAAARDVLQGWLQREPTDAAAQLDLALALHQLGQLEAALACYRRVCDTEPGNGYAWYCLGAALNEQGDSAGAHRALDRALAIAPGDADAWAELATLHEADNRLEAAGDAVERGLAVVPGHPRLLLEAARLARRRGRSADADLMLASLDPGRLPLRARAGYWFERGRALDRLQRPSDAFHAFGEGNRLARAALRERPADADAFPHLVARTREWLRQPDRARWLQAPPTAPLDVAGAPVFLLGFPRSGITLVNVLLGCAAGVRTLEERPTIERCAARLESMAGPLPQSLDALGPGGVEALRVLYWQGVEAEGGSGMRQARLLVDMFPMRTPLLPVVARLFSHATVVFVRRHPCDVVLSNFMQHFAVNAATVHFFDMEATVRLYCDTMELWLALRPRMPMGVVDVQYEALATRPEPTLRALLAALQLPWDPAVLRHAERMRSAPRVTTSSYHQVAQPVYADAAGRWTRYRAQLSPWLPRLLPIAQALGYPA